MRITRFLFPALSIPLAVLFTACPKGGDPNVSDPDPPSLCPTAAYCPDGRNPELIRTWDPVGGIFKGIDITHGCVGGVCPDVLFTFFADSTYRFDYTEVGQDSGQVFPVNYTESGTWKAVECECREIQLPYGTGTEQTGRILLSPDGDAPYTIRFQGFSTGLYLNTSSRDSTFTFFLKRK